MLFSDSPYFLRFWILNNKLMSITDNDAIKSMDVREDGVYMTYVPADGADPVSKKLGNPDPSSSRFRYYTTSPGGSNTYYLPDGIYVYFTMNGGGGGTSVNGSTWQANFPTNSTNFQYGKYGIVDTSKSNVVSQRVNAYDHTATALFYKISED